MSIIPYEKWARIMRIISQHGGVFKSLYKLWRMDTLKEGKLMGTDQMGNKYYENQNYMIGRSRWVEYNINVRWNYDASQVSPEWFGWLHYKTDCVPCCDEAKYQLNCCSWSHRWLLQPAENPTGTCRAFYPYSTQKAHILPWDGLYRNTKLNQSICNYSRTLSRAKKLKCESDSRCKGCGKGFRRRIGDKVCQFAAVRPTTRNKLSS